MDVRGSTLRAMVLDNNRFQIQMWADSLTAYVVQFANAGVTYSMTTDGGSTFETLFVNH